MAGDRWRIGGEARRRVAQDLGCSKLGSRLKHEPNAAATAAMDLRRPAGAVSDFLQFGYSAIQSTE
ncbi:MAG: hypothetical protein QOI26_598 [Pseudonocardiales bacterium]|jgi:hypothetical protein|nr:hypothetical protein [Pseudonocardiales bacterium]